MKLLQPHTAELVPGVFCLGLGGYMLLDVWSRPGIATKAAVGPGVFPVIIGAGLAVVGLRLCHEAWQRRGQGAPFPELDIRAAFQGALAFLVMILTLEWLGWVIAGTLMYATVAHAFGERRVFRSLLLGLGLTVATWWLFDRMLDLALPVGTVVEQVLTHFGYEI
ncbi:MAG TPA: tripartite tricarboxylate transporter TctB family protein [Paracoccus sp. (in: a-proteobacteria)]|uniref:tripartite tricarboxylate transporter TctB family protein n=1 Tax=Paracoccus sp. TaxID=267 RepID=UPI002B814B3F|nr:tripartite tricarboxylate transporter TctB family protein [Paracoccus sp. (in: a-proteobacteria)]HWL55081.1 tripartite tricarboxylate transporter TctB family protein [Paracoccus sp. (in: a-proteobacteria)]